MMYVILARDLVLRGVKKVRGEVAVVRDTFAQSDIQKVLGYLKSKKPKEKKNGN